MAATYVAVNWEAAPFAVEYANSFASVLELVPRITIASMVAHLVSQHYDVFAFNKWKEKTRGKHLWFRNIASTVVSQAIDTCIFITIAFYGVMDIVPLLIGQYVVKLLIAIMDTPFMYWVDWLVDRIPAVSVSKKDHDPDHK